MKKNQIGESIVPALVMIVLALFLLLGGVGGCMYGYPQYKVYAQRMEGTAEFQRAESNRQIAVREAEARRDAAVADAESERIRAQGAADANKIVAGSLGGPEGYLRYLAIEVMRVQATNPNGTTVYVPTEGNIPITEAMRFNKPAAAREADGGKRY